MQQNVMALTKPIRHHKTLLKIPKQRKNKNKGNFKLMPGGKTNASGI